MNHLLVRSIAALGIILSATAQSPTKPQATWPTYGGDAGGQRFSSATQINKSNVNQLKVAWTFHTGAIHDPHAGRGLSFEATPILFHGALYLTTPFDTVFAIDPATGKQIWTYDPQVVKDREYDIITSRGAASWPAETATTKPAPVSHEPCATRVFLGTMDARLLALDAATGKPCADFGNNGAIDLTQNVDFRPGDKFSVTSAPAVIGDVVVVGSGIPDNQRVDVERGDVRGYDARSGKLLWTWSPIPWADKQQLRTGAANTWGAIAADPEHNLVFLPTSSPSPDYYGGLRKGDDRDADSLVAVNTLTGQKVWSFQVVHHDIWDYDIAAEPLLFTFRGTTPAVAISTKMGLVFVLNRLTGQPLYPVTERPVPQSDVPGEVTSPTQPFPALPSLSPLKLDLSGPISTNDRDEKACRHLLSGLRYEGIYTPPSLQGTLLFPSNVGGVNWGSAALDPATGILYANTNRLPYLIKLEHKHWLTPAQIQQLFPFALAAIAAVILLIAYWLGRRNGLIVTAVLLSIFGFVLNRHWYSVAGRIQQSPWLDTGGAFASHFGKEYGPDEGAPYIALRQPVTSLYDGQPCGPTPWGTTSALNLNTGTSAWQTPLGTKIEGQHTGTVNVGGPIVTAGGLVFTAASQEPFLRAFDSATGEEVWKGSMPVPSQATPMSYTINGKQFIVIADGGHYAFGTTQSDGVLAFALP
jgi:quinoprotein glucose dehydrogenase